MIDDIPVLLQCYRGAAAASATQDPKHPKENFIDFIPPEIHTIPMSIIKASSLPVGIQACHAWDFKYADRRRTSVVGRDGVTLNGVYAKPLMIPKHQPVCPGRFCPVLGTMQELAETEKAEEEDAERLLVTSNGEILGGVKEVNGWRCSYRKSEPEKKMPKDYNKMLARKYKAFQDHGVRLPHASRTRNLAQRVIADTKLRKKAKDKYHREKTASARPVDAAEP